MTEENPNLIPLPSIGESASSQTIEAAPPRKSKLWLVVTLCVVLGVGLGIFVYQQSIAPATKTPTKPTASKAPIPSPVASPLPSPSPAVPEVSQVTPQSNVVTMPKTGEVRVYFATYEDPAQMSLNHLVRLTIPSGSADLIMPRTLQAGDKMAVVDSGLVVTAGQQMTIELYDDADETTPSYGWIAPDANKQCGGPGYSKSDASALIAWATQKAAGEQLVSVQCWGDYGPANDTSRADMNDFLAIISYTPAGASTTVSPSPSPTRAASPSPSPSRAASPTPAASPSVRASVAASPRVTMPEGSSLPDAGVFEVTAGTIGVGLVFVLLGALGLLVL